MRRRCFGNLLSSSPSPLLTSSRSFSLSTKKNHLNSSTTTTTTTTLSSKLLSTAGFALVAVSGVALARPKIESLPHGSTEKQVASAALVFFATVLLRACLSLVWGLGLGKIGESSGAAAAPAAPASGGAAATRPRRARRA